MINKTKLALGIATALTLTGVLVSPQAMAKSHKSKLHTVTESSSSYSQSTTSNSRVDALEAQLQAMQAEISRLRADANRPRTSAEAGKVQELDQWMNSVKSEPKESKKSKDNMLYFRGGYSGNDASMVATTNAITGNLASASTGTAGHSGGWNFGAGIDFNLNDNLFGLMDKTDLLGELDLNYVDLGTFTSSVGGGFGTGNSTASQSMLRITAAPKIKFLNGSKIRPWIIPVGFTLNVISPPSQANSITELKPAMHFGTGLDYNIWKSLYVGADVRYNLAVDKLDGTNVNGLTAGGSLGFGF
jgi:opacity protein-like surface antigen